MSDLGAPTTTGTTPAAVASAAGLLADGTAPGKPRSLASDAWHELRRNPLFVIAGLLISLLLVVTVFPGLFTSADPHAPGDLENYLRKPELTHFFAPEWLGYDGQGRSIYVRLVYGARASVTVGLGVTLAVFVLGSILGLIAGYFGGWIDALVSRITDVFFGIPFLLGAMVILTTFTDRSVWTVSMALAFLGWTVMTRVMRGSVVTVKQADYVLAAKALGAGTPRILIKHILPNAIAPVIVVATIALGGYITAEATLSFLGIGLTDTFSWGGDIADGQQFIRTAQHVLWYPAAMLSATVLAFLMFGDAVRDALDPKSR